MLTAISTKTGLAPGVNLANLKPYVREGLVSSAPVSTVSAPADEVSSVAANGLGLGLGEGVSLAGSAAVVGGELDGEAMAEVKVAVMKVCTVDFFMTS